MAGGKNRCLSRYKGCLGRGWGAEGWPRFEFEVFRAYILQSALLSTLGSHEKEKDARHSAESDS